MKKAFYIIVWSLVISAFNQSYAQVTLPPGFSQVFVAGGITQPTTMAIAPDGRFFIVQQNGVVKVFKNGSLLPQPFITLTVQAGGERGLLGITLDPDFSTNQYVYLCYTMPSGPRNRVSRFTASGDTVMPGSETVLLDLDTLIAVNHGGGHLGFGPDGKLYISAGENERPLEAQILDSYLGKILRINSDGTVPNDNPFPGPGKRQRVYAYGLRNPFTYDWEPGTGMLWVNDVGDTTWEEINDATIAGGNFGWPYEEGYSTDTAYESPVFVYQHGIGDSMGCSITGGTFFEPGTTNYPSNYLNRYYYIDYCGNWINSISVDSPHVWSNFATNIANYSVGITTGPDGNLYFLSRNNEALYKITYTPDSLPHVVNQPASQTVSLGSPVTFTATATGTPPLNYQWRKGTTAIPGATDNSYTIPSVSFADSGDYNMIVSNIFGSDTSEDAHLSVSSNQAPVAVIDTPLTNSLYSGGETIYFHGSAVDPEEGALPDSVFEWEVVFHHETHVHPGPLAGTGVSSGSFVIPNSGEVSADVFYRLFLTVHDSNGTSHTDSVDILPRTSTFIVNTDPPGLMVEVGGQPVSSPDTVLSVEGIIRLIGVPYVQSGMVFTHWSNGGTLNQTFATPVNDTVFTAYYAIPTLNYSLGNDTTLCLNDLITLDAGAGYSTYAWSEGSVGQYLAVQSATEDTFTYAVSVTDITGAAGTDTITLYYVTCSSVEDIPGEVFNVFPVPSSGEINIEISRNCMLNVTDLAGRLIEKNIRLEAGTHNRITLDAGVYMMTFSSDAGDTLHHRKIIVIGN